MKKQVWIVDDDHSIRWVLEKALQKSGLDIQTFSDADTVLAELNQQQPAVIVSDIRMPGTSGLSLLDQARKKYPQLPVVVMTAYADLGRAVAAFQGGAFEYLPKPFDVDEAVATIQKAIRSRQSDKSKTTKQSSDNDPVPEMSGIIGTAPAMQEVFRAIGRLSSSHMTVLITGESGTGKELVARALHEHSPRSSEAFIALNMAAMPKELLESELFGHERGAFTGATERRKGRFEQADGGTLFMDEIGDMPAQLQTRLLRVLADGEFYRVGGHSPIKVDVRIVAATHQKLEDLVTSGSFREDLYHRLNVIRLQLPPLRKRTEDIQPLMTHFLNKVSEELLIDTKNLHPKALALLQAYPWPGNVRQLENVCRWLSVMAPAREIHPDELPEEVKQIDTTNSTDENWLNSLKEWVDQRLADGESNLLERAMPMFERALIESTLAKTGGRRQAAAKLLGYGRNTLTRKIKELQIEI